MISNLQKKHKLVNKDGMEYYTIDGMEQIHTEMLRLLKIVDKIASENDISYWIASGSMIGVARHKGFIPWDDDLDIELLKVDYIKLIKCLTEYSEKHDDAFLFFPSPQKYHCCNYFASNKFFLRTQGSPSVIPVKVDIRPYNCIRNTAENIAENVRIKDIANMFVFGKSYGYVGDEELKKIDSKIFFNRYNKEYGLYDATKEDAILVPPYYEYSMNFEFKYEHLFPLVRIGFEDIMVYIPRKYDYILSSIYGDYMKLPQLKHRVPAACELYLKEIPISKLKKIYGVPTNNRIKNKIMSLLFLTKFHGIKKYILYKFLENKINLCTDYEKANW